MCGVIGLWNLNGEKINQSELDRFTDTLRHRGPDGRGTYVDPKATLGFGHRRLAILDLSQKGTQPLSYANRRYWITYNGEIYNFLELRAELQGMGYAFKTDTDTEVILAAFVRWGEACQLKFNGMWAFAIWDTQEQSLFLSRDRFAVKPLFYYWDQTRFAFASETKAFLALDWFSPEFDQARISQAISAVHQFESGEETIWKNVKRLRAGHSLTLSRGRQPQAKRWWNTLEHLPSVASTWPAQVDQFSNLFEDACRIRMHSDVPLATSLSGGMDSSAVACMLYELKKKPSLYRSTQAHRAFVATFPGTSQDEKVFADMVADYTKSKVTHIQIDFEAGLHHLEEILFQFEEIYDLAILGPWLVYRELRNNKIPISLDGHGGDELLAGYHHYPIKEYEHASQLPVHLRRMIECQRILSKMYPHGSPNRRQLNVAKTLLARYAPKSVALAVKVNRKLRAHYSATPKSFGGYWLTQNPDTTPLIDFVSDTTLMDPFDPLNQELYYDFHYGTLPPILRNFDRLSMAHGVEVRSPFLDWRLVTYCFALPSHTKLSGQWTKAILREAFSGKMPEKIRTRTDKVGFSAPVRDWLKGSLRSLITDVVTSQASVQSAFWDGPALKKAVEDSFAAESYDSIVAAWPYVQAKILQDLFVKAKRDLKKNSQRPQANAEAHLHLT